MSWPPRWTEPHWRPAKTGPKPKRRIRVKPRSAAERRRIDYVRGHCVTRDGHCRAYRDGYAHTCGWPSEWAHMPSKRRSKTRGLDPEVRHTTADSLMLCRPIHEELDRHRLRITPRTARGCNGQLIYQRTR